MHWRKPSRKPHRWLQAWSLCRTRGSWDCSACRRLNEIFINVYRYLTRGSGRIWHKSRRASQNVFSGIQYQQERQQTQVEIQEIPFIYSFYLFIFHLQGGSYTGTGCAERLWRLHPWRLSKPD